MKGTYRPIENEFFHTYRVDHALDYLNTAHEGLTDEEAVKRLDIYGKNELEEGRRKTFLEMFIGQFKDFMVIVLLIAALISAFMGELADASIIMVVVVLNAVLGIIQESKAEKALSALKKMASPYAKVMRNGHVRIIKTEEIVPGDIVIIEAGDYVPADIRLVESANLKIEEAALTGESVPVEKTIHEIDKTDIVIGDRKNMAYLASSVTYGRGSGVVVGTGMKTEVGKIAGYISKAEAEETPLQRKLAQMGKYLSIAVIIIAVVIFLAGVLQGRRYFEMFLTAVSLAVAAIPEGLPAVVTIVLALGVQRMAKRNAIIRKLPAVETLGSTQIICSDKTGTLTQNKMTVKEVFYDGRIVKADVIEGSSSNAGILMEIAALCNDSKVTKVDGQVKNIVGDPTETALVSFAAEKGFDKYELDKSVPRRSEIPFDSDRKLMTTINDLKDRLRVFTKGAPDILIERCSKVLIGNSVQDMSSEILNKVRSANAQMAGKALRVLALAYKDVEEMPGTINSDTIEHDLVFAGLVGMIDPPREEVKHAVKVCAKAGIRPVMITGDHRDTAAAIAKELNIIKDESEVITGSELDRISEQEFVKQVEKYSVYARVSPEHKVRIVSAWRKNGHIVAMTGDGVNDAPALKNADIGVGMGITGTDVAKGVSDMVLADDNFATIVIAVEEGRKIYDNIRKTVQFLLSCNFSEVATLLAATFLNWTILYPIHILWINLVTDSLPALALGLEKAEQDIMERNPRKANATFFAEGVGTSIVYQGIMLGLITLATYYAGLTRYSKETATTMAFATLGLIQLFHSLNTRSNTKSLFKIGLFGNVYLTGAIIISAILQVSVIIIPFLNRIFRVTPLNGEQWLIVLAASVSIIPVVELVKLLSGIAGKKERV